MVSPNASSRGSKDLPITKLNTRFITAPIIGFSSTYIIFITQQQSKPSFLDENELKRVCHHDISVADF